jgi:pyocin large subunit-like protein
VDRSLLKKHRHEFGSISKEQYLLKAQELRDHPAGGDILENVRPDGVITRFDRATGDFIAFNAGGVIRTYFRPNDGEAYFRRQTLRRH